MSRVFLETSALVKLYHMETGSDKVDAVIKPTDTLTISSLARLEFISLIYKQIRKGNIAQNIAKRQLVLFQHDMSNFHIIKYDYHIFTIAAGLLETYAPKMEITFRDVIHVASARPLQKMGLDYYISCNSTIIKLAKMEGFRTLNPLE